MTQATHTQGPWTVSQPSATCIDSPLGTIAALAFISNEADAHLIAAAPDLLAALEALHACHRAFSGNDNWTMLDDESRSLAENAIAKAKGN